MYTHVDVQQTKNNLEFSDLIFFDGSELQDFKNNETENETTNA